MAIAVSRSLTNWGVSWTSLLRFSTSMTTKYRLGALQCAINAPRESRGWKGFVREARPPGRAQSDLAKLLDLSRGQLYPPAHVARRMNPVQPARTAPDRDRPRVPIQQRGRGTRRVLPVAPPSLFVRLAQLCDILGSQADPGVRQSSEQKVGLSPACARRGNVSRESTRPKSRGRASEIAGFCPGKTVTRIV
jgi:hypothetical protein